MRRALVAFALAMSLLSGCGGGGGGSSAPSVGGGGNSGSGGNSGGGGSPGVQQVSVQQGLVQQSLSTISASKFISQYGNPSSTPLSTIRRVMSGKRRQTSTCSNGLIVTTTPETSNTTLISIGSYYDSACTELWYTFSGQLTTSSSTAGTLTGNYIYYPLGSSTPYEYASVTLNISGIGTGSGYFSLGVNVGSAPSSSFLNLGVGCTISSTSDSCSLAAADHAAQLNSDVAAAETVTASLSSSGTNVALSLSGSASAYTGALNSTSIVAQGNFGWIVTGGTQVSSVAMSGSITVAPSGLVTAATLTLTDSVNNGTATVTYNSVSQTYSGTITQTSTGTPIANFTVNQNGSGTVTFSNGTTSTIANGTIVTAPAATPAPTPTPVPQTAFSCPSSYIVTNSVRGGTSSGESVARRLPRRAPAAYPQTGLIAVAYDRASFQRSTSSFTRSEQSVGGSLVQGYDLPYIGKVVRVLSVSPSQTTTAMAALRAQAGVLSVGLTGQRRYAQTSQQYFGPSGADPYFQGFTTAQISAGGSTGPQTYHVGPLEENGSGASAADVPGQWDMHIIGLEYVFGYSQNGNSVAANSNVLGTHNVKLAIIDTGEDATHPELAPNVIYQKCYITNTNNVQSTSTFSTDPDGHGTDVAGIAAGDTFNALGFASAGGNTGILAYRVFPTPDDNCANPSSTDPQCGSDTRDIAAAIDDAVTQGASVISMSIGGGGCTNGVDSDPVEGAAVSNAIAHNVVVIAASGNENASTVDAPGCDTGVIAVGASAVSDGVVTGSGKTSGSNSSPVEYVASYSNYGSVNGAQNTSAWGIVAPGGDPNGNTDVDDLHWIENIWTSTPFTSSASDMNFTGTCSQDFPNATVTTGTVDCRTLIAGTSQATPHVAGVAALICAVNPADCTPTAMKTLLCQTAHNINDPHEGCGRLNAYRAIAIALGDPSPPPL
jgi:subtilisin family serine protease